MPPDEAVEVVSEKLQDGLGDVDVAALLVDFAVNQLGNLGGRVVLRTVELESLTDGRVVVKDALEGMANVRGLYQISKRKIAPLI